MKIEADDEATEGARAYANNFLNFWEKEKRPDQPLFPKQSE